MAAYDLRVQKPASLAIPDSPGANDLARFLSVSESSRANREKEELNQNMFDWEKGAGQRKLTAEENERERVRNQNREFGNALTGSTEGYITSAKENYRLADDAVSRFRETYPNATEDQIENVRRSARDKITQDPNAYIKSVEMTRAVESDLISNYGYSPEQARKSAQERVGSYFTPKGEGPNKDILKAMAETVQGSGITDGMNDYNVVRGENGELLARFGAQPASRSGTSTSGSGGSKSFMESQKFLKQYQLDNENNEYRPGTRGTFSWNFPFTQDEIYKDDLEEMGTLMQSREGINPIYLNSVIQGLAKEGQLPKGVSASDMKNPDGSFYKTVKENASLLQRQTEGNNGSGGNSTGQRDVALGDIAQMVQGDTAMKVQALNQMLEMSRNSGGGTLTSEEQYEIMNDPGLLEEFGIALEQSLQQQGRGNNAPAPAAAPLPTTAPVVENSGAEANQGSSEAAEEGDNPELTSFIEGENKDDQPTEEEFLKAILDTPVSNSGGYKTRDELVEIQKLKKKVRNNNATKEEKDSLVDIFSGTDLEIEVTLPENVKDMTFTDLRESVPEGADRQKIYDLYRKGKAGDASKAEMRQLSDALNSGSRKTK
jgi:hypothetical protein